MTGTDGGVPATRIIVTVFLPFACGYYLSYLTRVVNAVIADDLSADIGVDAAALGVLTAAYFITFAAFQLPLGLLLDRYGPRRVEAALLVVAAFGALLFSLGNSVADLTVGRALIGLGMSACLMAAFKANVLWWPVERLPLVNGLILACGGLGALTASIPVAALLEVTDWRGLFRILAGLILACAALIQFATPRHDPVASDGAPQETSLHDQLATLRTIFAHPGFWRIAGLGVTVQSVFLAYQALWAAEWFRVVDGAGEAAVAQGLRNMALAMIVGHVLVGLVTDRLGRYGIRPSHVLAGFGALFLINLAWLIVPGHALGAVQWPLFILLGGATVLGYAMLGNLFPSHMTGRAITALNLLGFASAFAVQSGVGAAIATLVAWGVAPADAHRVTFAFLLLYCIAGYGVFVWPWLRPGRSADTRLDTESG